MELSGMINSFLTIGSRLAVYLYVFRTNFNETARISPFAVLVFMELLSHFGGDQQGTECLGYAAAN